MADNTITVIGNVTRDPELRFTPSGQAVATFGAGREPPLAEPPDPGVGGERLVLRHHLLGPARPERERHLVKGSRVIVTGRLEQRSWETDQGDKRSKVEIVADEVGPSLRWATADITRNERKGRDGSPAAAVAAAAAPSPLGAGRLRPR